MGEPFLLSWLYIKRWLPDPEVICIWDGVMIGVLGHSFGVVFGHERVGVAVEG